MGPPQAALQVPRVRLQVKPLQGVSSLHAAGLTQRPAWQMAPLLQWDAVVQSTLQTPLTQV